MANEEHLAILRQGVEVWNKWREENPDTISVLGMPDLHGAKLRRAMLSGAKLGWANLSGAELFRANLSEAKLSKAKLSGVNLGGADLKGADLSGANLSRADLSRAMLSGADLSRAKLKGADLREANLIGADLRGANLNGANLNGANLRRAELGGADLRGTDLSRADLSRADLSRADLSRAKLSRADLSGSELSEADLREANLIRTDLTRADLSRADIRRASLSLANLGMAKLMGANLSGTNLNEVNLSWADLSRTDLSDADLGGSFLDQTIFADVDLSAVKSFEKVHHLGPSTIGIDPLYKSQGKIPEVFLRGAGVPEELIAYLPSLITGKAIQFYSCFISYSTKDLDFAERLHADLQSKGVRCWYAPEDIKGGRKMHEQIPEAIRLYDKLLLVLSENSMRSEWVKTEIHHAWKDEKRENRRKLFPISLVGFEKIEEWEAFDADMGKDMGREIREYFIPDFSNWKEHDKYKEAFERLMRDLDLGAGK